MSEGCRFCENWVPKDLDDYYSHHMQHVRLPRVVIKPLKQNILDEIVQSQSYSVPKGKKVTPIKISVRKDGNSSVFFVASEEKKSENMIGLNGISIQRRNGSSCSAPVLPKEDAVPIQSNPQDLLNRLSTSGIVVGKKPSKSNETEKNDIRIPELTSSENSVVPDVAKNEPGILGFEAPDENMLVLEEAGIDILKKLLDSVPALDSNPLPQLPETSVAVVDDDIIIETEIQRSTRNNEAENNEDRVVVPPANTVSEAPAPIPEIRLINSLVQPPDFWNGTPKPTQQDPLMTPSERPNFFNPQPNEPPEYLSLEHLGQELDMLERVRNSLPRKPPPGQISVIPQRQMQAPRPPVVPQPPHYQMPPCMPTAPQHAATQKRPSLPRVPTSFYEQRIPIPTSIYSMYSSTLPQAPLVLPPVLPDYQPVRQRAPRPQIQPRSFESMAAPRAPVKRAARLHSPKHSPHKIPRTYAGRNAVANAEQPTPGKQSPTDPATKAANALASRGITVTTNRGPTPQKSPGSAEKRTYSKSKQRPSAPITNHDVPRPEPCATVDLTTDDLGFICNLCRKEFTTMASLNTHRALHRRQSLPNYKCDKCTSTFLSAISLRSHKAQKHTGRPQQELAIPVVDLSMAGSKTLLARAGVTGYIPLSQMIGDKTGNFALPVMNLETFGTKTSIPTNGLGATNVLVLGTLSLLQNK